MNLRGAIECAIDQCIEENVLKDFLTEHRSEVVKMMQLDYTFERQLELEREESYTKGREEGQQILADVLMRLQNGETAEELIANGIDAKTVELALAVNSHTTVIDV